MLRMAETLATAWISRRAKRDPIALAAVRTRQPATVITGGGSGIGYAIARQFAAGGSAVVLIGRTESRLSNAARTLADEFGIAAHALVLDVTDKDAADRLSAHMDRLELYCDCLVNSAGLGLAGVFHDHPAADIDALIETNVSACTRLTRAMLPDMLARGHGGVMAIASLGGFVPGPHQAAYYASKAYVISLYEAIASETAGSGVRVAVVTPGPVDTDFHAKMAAEGALYRQLLPSLTADRVARSAVRGYRLGRRVIAPGVAASIAAYALRVLPHALSVPLTGWLLNVGRPKA